MHTYFRVYIRTQLLRIIIIQCDHTFHRHVCIDITPTIATYITHTLLRPSLAGHHLTRAPRLRWSARHWAHSAGTIIHFRYHIVRHIATTTTQFTPIKAIGVFIAINLYGLDMIKMTAYNSSNIAKRLKKYFLF